MDAWPAREAALPMLGLGIQHHGHTALSRLKLPLSSFKPRPEGGSHSLSSMPHRQPDPGCDGDDSVSISLLLTGQLSFHITPPREFTHTGQN